MVTASIPSEPSIQPRGPSEPSPESDGPRRPDSRPGDAQGGLRRSLRLPEETAVIALDSTHPGHRQVGDGAVDIISAKTDQICFGEDLIAHAAPDDFVFRDVPG